MSKPLTITELIAQKEKLRNRKKRTQTLLIESLDSNIVIQEPDREIALEALGMSQDDSKSNMADVHVVYHSVIEPNLKDTKLQQEFGCVEPTDIVSMIFLPGEIDAISGHALQLAGYGKGVRQVDNELKN